MNLLVPLFMLALSSIVRADMNITVDDSDRIRITYNPPEQWEAVRDSRAVDGYLYTATIAVRQGAYAMFNFSGAHSIHYMGYGVNPDQVGMATIWVTLDGQVNDVPEKYQSRCTRPANPIFTNRTRCEPDHVITVAKTSPSGDNAVNIDAFIYTIPDPPSTTSSTPAAAAGTSSHSPMSQNTILGIVFGLVGACGFLGALVVLYFHRRLYNRGNTYLPKTAASPSNSCSKPGMSFPPSYINAWSNGLVSYPAYRKHQPTKPHLPSPEKGRLYLITPLPKSAS